MIENSIRNIDKENEKESNKNVCPNVLFLCKKCKDTPLLIPSSTDEKILKYCNEEKKFEVITPINLIDMTNIKCIKKKLMSKDKRINDDHIINNGKFICSLHGKEFINYCNECDKDICFNCSKNHFNHELYYYSKYLPSATDIREGNKILSEMKRELGKFKQSTKEIIKTCESLIYIKEIILNSLKSIDLDKLNFYSIMNYKNILKLKIKLIEKPYEIINPMYEVNSKILLKIKKDIKLEQKETFKEKLEINNNILSEYDINQINISNKGPNSDQPINNFFPKKSYELDVNNSERMDKINNKSNQKSSDSKQSRSKKIKNVNKLCLCKNKDINKKKEDMELKSNKNNMIVKIELDDDCLNENKIQFSYMSDYEKSKIIDDQQLIFIINSISSKLNKIVKKLYLCYRATSDGDKATTFHEKCDRLKNIIILINTSNGKKFGGFSSESWDNNSQELWKKDNDAFIFSIDNFKYYEVIRPERALFCHKDYGPIFGNGEILIPNNFFLTPSTCLEKNVCYKPNDNSFPLSGLKEFYVTQIEAYKIDYLNL
jgi:hypothetical protein